MITYGFIEDNTSLFILSWASKEIIEEFQTSASMFERRVFFVLTPFGIFWLCFP